MTLPPWLDISPDLYLRAMTSGSQTGLEERRTGDSERENFQRNALEQQQLQAQEQARQAALAKEARQRQQQAEEFSAGQSLQRDKLTADIIQTKQQQDAADALRQTQLQQAGLLGQGRLDAENTRNENEDEFHQGELDNQSAANDLRASAQGTSSTPSDKMKLEQLRGLNHARDVALSKGGVETAAKIDAQIQQLLNPPTPAVQPTPAADALKQKYHDAVQSGNQTAAAAATSDLRALLASQQPAADSLTPPTAGTGTSALPPSVAPQGYASPPGGGAMVPLPDAAAGLSQSPASKDPLLQDNTIRNSGVKVKDKKSGKVFVYRGNPDDIPTDQYEIIQ